MNDLIIRQARRTEGDVVDIVIHEGKISAVGPDVAKGQTAKKQIDLNGKYFISAGWIDAHTHCCPSSPIYFDEPDLAGAACGVTTVIDAGSVGADDVDSFFYRPKPLKRTSTLF